MAWRPSLEKQGVAEPKPAAASEASAKPRGFSLSLSAFSGEARALVGAAQELAAERGHAETSPVHVEYLLARSKGWGDADALDAELSKQPEGDRPSLAGDLLRMIDRAEARSALDGGRPVRPEDLRAALDPDADAADVDAEPDAPALDAPTRALVDEATEAARRRGRSLTPALLLARLLRRPEVARLIALGGVIPDQLVSGLDARDAAAGEGEPSPAARAAIARAGGEARRAGRDAVTPLDLAFGVVLGDEGAIGEVKAKRRLYATILRSAAEVELTPEQDEQLRRALGAAPRWSIAAARQAPLTALIAITSIAITLASSVGGEWVRSLVLQPPVRASELWQAITSIFPHGGALHLLFNVAWMWMLGVPLERRRGLAWTAAFFAWSAFVASVAQVAWSGGGIGLSGLLYGVAGYHWLVQRREPGSPIVLSRGNARLLGGWLLACVLLTELDILPIANMAHGMGLVTGLLVGWLATAKDRRIPLAVMAALTVGVTAIALVFHEPLSPLEWPGL